VSGFDEIWLFKINFIKGMLVKTKLLKVNCK